jgi:hypothetical protein
MPPVARGPYAGWVNEPSTGRSAWDTPIEEMLVRYLDDLPADRREAVGAHLRAALRAEPIVRGCPSLAMLTPIDLLGVRAHLEMHRETHREMDGQDDVEAALVALAAFLSWAREAGAHTLSAEAVAAALQPPDE